MVKKLLLIGLLAFFSTRAMPFEIITLGASNIGGHDVDPSKTLPVRLEEFLRADGFDVHVVNEGVDGDKPAHMFSRIQHCINENTRLVIFAPEGNDLNKSSSVEYSEKILSFLQEHKISAIYISFPKVQTTKEAEATASKYGAYYYGTKKTNMPDNETYFLVSMTRGKTQSHMTAAGDELWAKNMLPLIKRVLEENHIR